MNAPAKGIDVFRLSLPECRTAEQLKSIISATSKVTNQAALTGAWEKGKPGRHPDRDLWEGYLNLWRLWASDHTQEMSELKFRAESKGNTLSDCFAKTSVNQARALAFILNEMELYESEITASLQHL
jgi:hypothetical protein